jgi:hypothetical protein
VIAIGPRDKDEVYELAARRIVVFKEEMEQMMISKEIIDELYLKEGDTLEVRVMDGMMEIVPTVVVAKDQAWFWTEEWQREEREAEMQIREGRVSDPMDADEALKFLDQLKG